MDIRKLRALAEETMCCDGGIDCHYCEGIRTAKEMLSLIGDVDDMKAELGWLGHAREQTNLDFAIWKRIVDRQIALLQAVTGEKFDWKKLEGKNGDLRAKSHNRASLDTRTKDERVRNL